MIMSGPCYLSTMGSLVIVFGHVEYMNSCNQCAPQGHILLNMLHDLKTDRLEHTWHLFNITENCRMLLSAGLSPHSWYMRSKCFGSLPYLKFTGIDLDTCDPESRYGLTASIRKDL